MAPITASPVTRTVHLHQPAAQPAHVTVLAIRDTHYSHLTKHVSNVILTVSPVARCKGQANVTPAVNPTMSSIKLEILTLALRVILHARPAVTLMVLGFVIQPATLRYPTSIAQRSSV